VGDYPIRQLVVYERDFVWKAFLRVEPRCVGIALAEDLYDFGGVGGITLAEGLRDCGRRAVPLLNYTPAFTLQVRKARKTSVTVAE
jgi:hypothetical protein